MNFETSIFRKSNLLPLGMGMVMGSMSVNAVAAEPAEKPKKDKEKPMNVLFIMSDDMRTDLNVYGVPHVHTPNIDKLASEGVMFRNNYCQYPLSGPSRTSMMSGFYPTTSSIYNNSPWFGADHPDWVSFTMWFKNHGYTTYGSGKIYHAGIEDTESFTYGGKKRMRNKGVGDFKPGYVSYEDHRAFVARMKAADEERRHSSDRWDAVEGEMVSRQGDTNTANRTIEYIKQAAERDEPFFITCGLVKPHSPFVAPKEFFDLYNVNDIPLPTDFASLPMVPIGFPEGSIRENTADVFISRPATAEEAREYILAYWACISYVDWNVGRVVAALEEAGLRDETIIVFCSDHGFQLGEKGKWSKAGSLWERGTNAPLIIVDPRAKGNGQVCRRIVENIDIYPTMVDLCGLPKNEAIEGESIAPLLDDPNMEWNSVAYSVWDNHGKGVTGVTVRDEKYRYAEFFGVGAGQFLIDEENDPNELVNLAYDPAYADVVARMKALTDKLVEGQRELTKEEAEAQGLLK